MGDRRKAGVLMGLAGVLNAVTSGLFVVGLFWFGIGVFWLIPFAIGVFQVAEGARLLRGEPAPRARSIGQAGAVAGVVNANPLPLLLSLAAVRHVTRLPAVAAAPG